MYTFTHREPAFDGTSVQAAFERATALLNRQGGLDGYEYVADRKLIVIDAADTRAVRDVARESEAGHIGRLGPGNGGTHVARKIPGGWEFGLIIYGD